MTEALNPNPNINNPEKPKIPFVDEHGVVLTPEEVIKQNEARKDDPNWFREQS